MSLKQKAKQLQARGAKNAPQDSMLAHISPREASLLSMFGGAGKTDKDTGLKHYYIGDPGDPGAPNDGDAGTGGFDGGLGGLDGAPDTGTLGGTMSDAFGESSVTTGEMSDGQAAANDAAFGGAASASEAGFGFGVPDSFFSEAVSNPSFTGVPSTADQAVLSEDDGKFGKVAKGIMSTISNMALSSIMGKMGIPGFVGTAGKNAATAAQSDDPTAAGKAAVNTGFSTVMGMMGMPAVGLGLQGINALSEMGIIGAPNTNADGSPAPAGTVGSSAAGNSAGIGGSDLLTGLAGLYGYNQANKNINEQVGSLQGLFSQEGPYAQQLRQRLARTDAAGGRRSQYGNREVQLQAELAKLAAGNAPQIGNLRASQDQMRAQGLAQLISMMNRSGATDAIGSGLKGLFNQGMTSGVSSGFFPSQDVGMTDTPFPDLGYSYEG